MLCQTIACHGSTDLDWRSSLCACSFGKCPDHEFWHDMDFSFSQLSTQKSTRFRDNSTHRKHILTRKRRVWNQDLPSIWDTSLQTKICSRRQSHRRAGALRPISGFRTLAAFQRRNITSSRLHFIFTTTICRLDGWVPRHCTRDQTLYLRYSSGLQPRNS